MNPLNFENLFFKSFFQVFQKKLISEQKLVFEIHENKSQRGLTHFFLAKKRLFCISKEVSGFLTSSFFVDLLRKNRFLRFFIILLSFIKKNMHGLSK